jgi:diketogulonate reductase-like aldo/keto reductase
LKPPSRKRFGLTGLDVPVIGQGTWNMEREPKPSMDALRYGVELGLTHIDTAEIYGDGAVETLVGRALHAVRERVLLTSKVHPAKASRKGLINACEQSLRRLRTDHLDIYLLHWLSPYPVEETVSAFEALYSAGKIRHWGVSNLDEAKLTEFIEVAGPGRICCNQIMHHLGQRSIEHSLVPFCSSQQIAVVGYSPFGAGAFPPDTRNGNEVLAEVAQALDASARQVALAFLILKSEGFTIPKASNRKHVEENAAALSLKIPEEAIARLDEAFPIGPRLAGVPIW